HKPANRGTNMTPGVRRGRHGAALTEFGVLAPLAADAAVTDVFVNGPDEIWFDRGAGMQREQTLQLTEPELRDLAVRLIGCGGRHIDEASPCVDVRLHDGIRVHAV